MKQTQSLEEFLNTSVKVSEFNRIHGRLPEWRERGEQSFPLRIWINNQRKEYEAGNLSALQVSVLMSLGLNNVLKRSVGGRKPKS